MNVPVMPANRKFSLGVSVFFLLLCSADFTFAQATKCMVNGKALYTDGPCPAGAREDRMKSERLVSSYPGLPEVQRGRWGIDAGDFRDGDPYVEKVCGDPLVFLVREIERAKARGCTVQITNPAPTTTQVAFACNPGSGAAAGASPSGSAAGFVIVRRSARSLSVTARAVSGESQKAEMNRIGEC